MQPCFTNDKEKKNGSDRNTDEESEERNKTNNITYENEEDSKTDITEHLAAKH